MQTLYSNDDNNSFRAILEYVNEAFALFHVPREEAHSPRHWTFRFANSAFEQLKDWDTPSLCGKSLAEITPEFGQRWVNRLAEISSRGEVLHHEGRIPGLKGFFRVKAFSPAPEQVALLITDISERMQHQQQLQKARRIAKQANQAKDIFLANMSHEIRTPLNGIMGMLQLLQTGDADENREHYVSVAMSACQNLSSIVQDILEFSQIEAGAMRLQAFPFDARETVVEMLEQVQLSCRDKTIDLRALVDSSVPTAVIGDSARYAQIVMNLLGNAVKFTNAGNVSVSLSRIPSPKGTVRVLTSVADTGVGIAPERIATVFSPFVQAEEHLSRQYNGVGLGLGIVKALVSVMNGGICVESTPGEGTTVHFTCLFEQSPDASSPEALPDHLVSRIQTRSCHTELPTHDERILVADDDHLNRLTMQRLLEKLGYRVDTAVDGRQAARFFSKTRYDYVFLDLRMPAVDGFQAAELIRDLNSSVPIIAVTAHRQEEVMEETRKAGFTSCITKPLSFETLRRLLK